MRQIHLPGMQRPALSPADIREIVRLISPGFANFLEASDKPIKK